MNVHAILAAHQDQVTTAVLVTMVVVAAFFAFCFLLHRRTDWLAWVPPLIGVLGMFASAGTATVITEGYRDDAMVAVSAQIQESYGIEVDPDLVDKAWNAADHIVVQGAGVQQGQKKSLGVQLTEDGELTIYEGALELEPNE